MKKLRFFATLHFARQLTNNDKVLKRLILTTFHHGFTVGWLDKENRWVMSNG